jgi:MFS transporter, DHA1 family, multidrug resistance protein
MYLPGSPTIGPDLQASASEVQLTLTACLIGISVGQLLIGSLSDRLGRRPPLLAGLAASGRPRSRAASPPTSMS